MAVVILEDSELLDAFDAAIKRNDFHSKRKSGETYGRARGKFSAFQVSWQGTMGELATAKFFGLNWTPFARKWREIPADVGNNLEVRSTTYRNGDLLLHEKDNARSYFILARLLPPQMVELVGWIHGSEGKRERFWQPATGNWRYPCYRIPEKDLNPIETLREGEQNGYEADYRPPYPVPGSPTRLTEAELLDWAEEEGY